MECGGCARPRRPTRTSRPPPDRPRGSRRPRRPRRGPRAPRARERRWCGTRRRPSARASLEHLGDHVARPAAHRLIEVSRARAERTEGEHLDREIDGEPQEAYGSVSRTAVLAGAVADRNLHYRGREGGGQHGYIARHARKREDPIDHRAKVVRRLVAAAVVHEDDLVRPGDLLERPGEPPMEGIEALRLVEHRNHHRQCRTHSPAHRSTSRTSRQSLWPPKPNEFEMAARM